MISSTSAIPSAHPSLSAHTSHVGTMPNPFTPVTSTTASLAMSTIFTSSSPAPTADTLRKEARQWLAFVKFDSFWVKILRDKLPLQHSKLLQLHANFQQTTEDFDGEMLGEFASKLSQFKNAIQGFQKSAHVLDAEAHLEKFAKIEPPIQEANKGKQEEFRRGLEQFKKQEIGPIFQDILRNFIKKKLMFGKLISRITPAAPAPCSAPTTTVASPTTPAPTSTPAQQPPATPAPSPIAAEALEPPATTIQRPLDGAQRSVRLLPPTPLVPSSPATKTDNPRVQSTWRRMVRSVNTVLGLSLLGFGSGLAATALIVKYTALTLLASMGPIVALSTLVGVSAVVLARSAYYIFLKEEIAEERARKITSKLN